MSNIAKNVAEIKARIAEAACRAGRSPEEITVVAVTKTRTVAEIREAVAAGLTHLGENRVQELCTKVASLPDLGVTWHLVGSLQTNKLRAALGHADLIHSLDRWSLAEQWARRVQAGDPPVPALVQVNVAGEDTKHGLAPNDVLPFLQRVVGLGSLQIKGLMTIAPLADDPEAVRPVFRRLRRLAAEAAEQNLPGVSMEILSMGMTGDYETAIAEGATHVRIGTAIFGQRSY